MGRIHCYDLQRTQHTPDSVFDSSPMLSHSKYYQSLEVGTILIVEIRKQTQRLYVHS